MKSGLVFFVLAAILMLNCQCKSREQKSETGLTDSIAVNISRVECKEDTSHSYYIAIPDDFDTTENYPLVIAFDPQGDGNLAVRSMIGGAKHLGYIIAGSNVIRNGYENAEYAINILTGDILNRYPVNKDRMYAAGFSGGGRYAQILSQININIKAIISMGAGFTLNPSQPLRNNVPMLFIVGDEDFNYLEIMNSKEPLKLLGLRYYILEFHGKHEWPDHEIMDEALLWFEFDNCRRDKSRRNDPVIKTYKRKINENADRFILDQKVFSACKEYEKGIAFLTGLTNTRSLVNDMNHCKELPDYRNASEKMNKSLILESRLQQGYVSALNLKDTLWWGHEIRKLNQEIDQTEDLFRLPAYRRVKSFISMAAYSLSNQSIKADDLPRAEKITEIYQVIDPGNPDAYYFRALYYSKTDQFKMAGQLFKKAVDRGFRDFQKARQELPEEIYEAGLSKD
jgi:hypothetical protein